MFRYEKIGTLSKSKATTIAKLYAWSTSMQMLLFFVVSFNGIELFITHLLQLMVLLVFLCKYLLRIDISKFKPRYYRGYWAYLILGVLASLAGFISGAYDLNIKQIDSEDERIANLLFNMGLRPIVELLLAIYYFVYFVILPQYIFKIFKDLEYWFKVTYISFAVSIIIGFMNFSSSLLGFSFLPMHFSSWAIAPDRYYGLAGEPRDNFVYLIFGLSFLYLYCYITKKQLSKYWVAVIIIACILTQSASGILGILLFFMIYFFYSIKNLSFMHTFRLVLLFTFVGLLLLIGFLLSDRLQSYLEAADNLWFLLESKNELPFLMKTQSMNFYPIYDLTVKVRELNFFPLIIGSGFGSSGVTNSNYFEVSSLMNPHAQITRLIYDSGIIGTMLFIQAFLRITSHFTKNISAIARGNFFLCTILLLSSSLAHRSFAIYIYSGMFIAAFNLLNINKR